MAVQLLSPQNLTGLFQIQDIALFEVLGADELVLASDAPAWLKDIWPEAQKGKSLQRAFHFYFLDHFLEELRDFWLSSEAELRFSDVWNEQGRGDREWLLEAVAMRQGDQKFMVLRRARIDPEKYRYLMQQSRELSIEHGQLVKAVDRREVLLHCMVHDLSTPLASIKGSLHLLSEELPDQDRELAEIGLRQTSRMQYLLHDALTAFTSLFSDSEVTPVNTFGTADVNQVVHEAISALSSVATLKGVALTIECNESNIPSWTVVGDTIRLERVLYNFLENALRHTAPGSTVTVVLNDDGEAVCCSVEDEGNGVPEAQVNRLFDKYYQGRGQAGRSGIGLYFCRITIEGWGGSIGYKPGRKGGACFWFKLLKYRS